MPKCYECGKEFKIGDEVYSRIGIRYCKECNERNGGVVSLDVILNKMMEEAQESGHKKVQVIMSEPTIIRMVDDLGRIVIPKKLRERLDIQAGDELVIEEVTEGILLRRQERE